jgi:hypothetical protein
MHNKHAPHRAPGIIKHPLVPVSPILVHPHARVLLNEDIEQRVDDHAGIFALTRELFGLQEGAVDGGFEGGGCEAVEAVLGVSQLSLQQ